MDDNTKMLRAIINGQSALKQELLSAIEKVDQKVISLKEEVYILNQKTDKGLKKIHDRLNKLGKSLAYLEDDAPTSMNLKSWISE